MKLNYGDTTVFADSNTITRTEFYHSGTALPNRTVAMVEQPYLLRNDNFVVGSVAVIFFIIVMLLSFQRSVYPYRLKVFFATKRQYIEEANNENSSGTITTFLLISVSALCVAFILFNNMATFHTFDTTLGIPYWIIVIGYIECMLVVYAKAMMYYIVNWVFSNREASQRWMSGYFLVTSLTAFFIYPATMLYLFYPDSHNIVTGYIIFIVILYELLLLYKLFVNFTTKGYGYLPLFLYFCSVELMPAVVIWHTFDWINNNFIVKNLIY